MLFPRISFLASLLLVGSACQDRGDDVEILPIVWKGEHVEIGTELDLDAWCPGTLPRLDRHVGALKTLYEVPPDYVVTYYLFPPPRPDRGCREGILACSTGRAVFTSDLFDTHEVVHAVSDAYNRMPHFFEEGGASYWGETFSADFLSLDVRDVLDKNWSSGMGDPEYALAAHFTAYMVHTYGMDSYVDLLRATSRKQSREEFEVSFEQTMGVSLDDAIDDYDDQWPDCDVKGIERWFDQCAQPGLKLPHGEFTDFDLDISCADPEVVGPSNRLNLGADLRIWRDVTIDLETNNHDINFDAPAVGEPNTVIMEFKRCGTECGKVRTITPDNTEDPNEYNIGLSPGRYVVRVSRGADDPGPVRFRWFAQGI